MRRIETLASRCETGWHWLRLDIKEPALSVNLAQAARNSRLCTSPGMGANLDNFASGSVPLSYLTQFSFLATGLDAILLEQQKENPRLNVFFRIVQSIALELRLLN